MTKEDYLKKFRLCPSIDILEITIGYMYKNIPENEFIYFSGAYDHRRAELKMNKLYTNVPSDVWRLV